MLSAKDDECISKAFEVNPWTGKRQLFHGYVKPTQTSYINLGPNFGLVFYINYN